MKKIASRFAVILPSEEKIVKIEDRISDLDSVKLSYGKSLNCVIYGEGIYLKIVTLPLMSKDEANEALAISELDSISFDGDFCIESVILSKDERKMKLLMIAYKESFFVDIYDYARKHGFKLERIDTVPSVLLLIVNSDSVFRSKPVIFTMLEDSCLGIYIFDKGELAFVREVSYDIKTHHDDIISEISRVIYYWSFSGGPTPLSLYLFGKNAYDERIMKNINSLMLDGVHIYEFENNIFSEKIDIVKKARYIHLIASLLEGERLPDIMPSFLKRLQSQFKAKVEYITCYSLIAIIIIIGFFISYDYLMKSYEIDKIEKEILNLREEKKELLLIESKIDDQLKYNKELKNEISSKKNNWIDIRWGKFLNDISMIVPEGAVLDEIRLSKTDKGDIDMNLSGELLGDDNHIAIKIGYMTDKVKTMLVDENVSIKMNRQDVQDYKMKKRFTISGSLKQDSNR